MEANELRKIVDCLEDKFPHGPDRDGSQLSTNCISSRAWYLFSKGLGDDIVQLVSDRQMKKKDNPEKQLLIKKHVDEYEKIIVPEWRKLRKKKIPLFFVFWLSIFLGLIAILLKTQSIILLIIIMCLIISYACNSVLSAPMYVIYELVERTVHKLASR